MTLPLGFLTFQNTGAFMTVFDWYTGFDTTTQPLSVKGIAPYLDVWDDEGDRNTFEAIIDERLGKPLEEIRGHVSLIAPGQDPSPRIGLFRSGFGSEILVARDLTRMGTLTRPAQGVYTFGEGALLDAFYPNYDNGEIGEFEDLLTQEATLEPVFASVSIAAGSIGDGGFGDSTNAGDSTNYGNAVANGI